MVCLMGMCSGDELHAESFCDEVNMCHGEGQPVLPILIPRFPSDRLRWFLGGVNRLAGLAIPIYRMCKRLKCSKCLTCHWNTMKSQILKSPSIVIVHRGKGKSNDLFIVMHGF